MSSYTTLGSYVAGEVPEDWVHSWDDYDGADVALTGYQVDVHYRVRHDGVWGAQVVLDDEASLFDAATGRTVVVWSAADFATAGLMAGELVVEGDGLRLARSFQCVILPPRGGTFPV